MFVLRMLDDNGTYTESHIMGSEAAVEEYKKDNDSGIIEATIVDLKNDTAEKTLRPTHVGVYIAGERVGSVPNDIKSMEIALREGLTLDASGVNYGVSTPFLLKREGLHTIPELSQGLSA